MASLSVNLASSVTSSVFAAESTPALGTLESAGAGITGGKFLAVSEQRDCPVLMPL